MQEAFLHVEGDALAGLLFGADTDADGAIEIQLIPNDQGCAGVALPNPQRPFELQPHL